MSDTTIFILSLSIGFAAIIGIIRYRKIDSSYHPFIYYACLALFIEMVNYVLIEKEMYKTLVVLRNVYGFVEFFLLTWLFHNWGLFKRKKITFIYIIVFFFLLWFTTLFIKGYAKVNYYFFIIYSFVIISFSISAFNKMVVNDRKNIFTNARFWICIGIIIFFTYFILINTAQLTSFKKVVSKSYINNLFSINIYANLLVNLLYAIAVIWMPRKKNIITLF
jgi:hypothetical protein